MPGTNQTAEGQPGSATEESWLAVRAGEDPWTTGELTAVHDELIAERDRLRADLAESEEDLAGLMRDFGDGSGDDSADTGGKILERDARCSRRPNAPSGA